MKGNLMLDSRWVMCNEAKVPFIPGFLRLCKASACYLSHMPTSSGQAGDVIK